MNQLNEKQRRKIEEKEQAIRELEESQKQNAEYDRKTAERRRLNTLQIKQDLQHQMVLQQKQIVKYNMPRSPKSTKNNIHLLSVIII